MENGADFDPYRVEGEVKSTELPYHGVKLRVVELEHHDIKLFSTQGSVTVPKDWREKINSQLNGVKEIFLEYLPVELDRINMIPGVGFITKRWRRQAGIEMFMTIAEDAAKKGVEVVCADAASGPLYITHELFEDQKRWRDEILKLPLEQRASYDGHDSPIHPLELSQPWAIDARRLLTARAMMQEALRVKDGTLVWVGPAAHAKRIVNYIERQIAAEDGKSVTKPEDMVTIGNPEDLAKLPVYEKMIGLDRRIRRWKKKFGLWLNLEAEKII